MLYILMRIFTVLQLSVWGLCPRPLCLVFTTMEIPSQISRFAPGQVVLMKKNGLPDPKHHRAKTLVMIAAITEANCKKVVVPTTL